MSRRAPEPIKRESPPSSSRRRIVSATLASASNTAVVIVYQLVSLPMFLAAYGSARYSDWLIMFGLPALLSISDLGVPDVIGSQMTMLRSAGSLTAARALYRRTTRFAILWLALMSAAIAAVIWLVNPAALLNLRATSEQASRLTLLALGLWLVLNLYWGMYSAAYQAVLEFHRNLRALAVTHALEFAAILCGVGFGASLPLLGFSLLGVRVVASVWMSIDLRRVTPWYERLPGDDADVHLGLKRLISPAIASMAFPSGNAIQNQGLLVVLGWRGTAATVVLVNSIRTMTNASYHLNTFLKAGITPELSARFGVGDIAGARSIAEKTTAVVTAANAVFAVGVSALGAQFLSLWSGGHLHASVFVVTLFALSATTDCVWHSMSNVAQSKNVHQRIAAAYFTACVLVLPICYLLAPTNGAAGVAISLFTTSVLVNVVTVPTTAAILHTTVRAYTRDSLRFTGELLRSGAARLSHASRRNTLS